jgi:serine/threonine protein kinase
MHIINLSKREYKRLKPIILSKPITQTEADLYEFSYDGERKIIKTIFTLDKEFTQAKVETIERLNEYKNILPTSFCIPDNLIAVRNKIKAFTVPYFYGEPLSSILNNPNIPLNKHIYYLTKIGEILEELNKIRTNTNLKNLFIGDLHESNIMINAYSNQIGIIDIDSCRIGTNYSYTSKYLTPFSLVKTQPDKYHINKLIGNGPGYIIPDKNSDIYCYIVMILNYITGDIFKYFTIDDFYEYLNILSKSGINKEILYLIENIVTKNENINPYEYLRELTPKDIQTSKIVALSLIKK